jgi:hypothetical protein
VSGDGAFTRSKASRARVALPLLIGLALALRALLAWYCPTSFGYVFDYYHEGVEHLYDTGRFPLASDCWQCYHPPLYYVLGLPFYAAGMRLGANAYDPSVWGLRGLTGLALIAGAVTTYFTYRIARDLTRDGDLDTLGLALTVSFPCLFISTYGPDADIVVAATMTAFLFWFLRFAPHPQRHTWKDAAWIGMLAGLAAATKYSGLLALATAGAVLGWRFVTGPARRTIVKQGLLILLCALPLAAPKYLDNYRRYGTPLFANGSAGDAFSAHGEYYWDHYDFASFDLGAAIDVCRPNRQHGMLTSLPVYRSVWTTLYGMAWTDLSFFSVRGRIDDPAAPYPDKHIPSWLVGAVLYLGLVPTALAMCGAVVSSTRRSYQPLFALVLLTMTSYLAWVVAQDDWALKTKYLLFLLPAGVSYSLVGARWVRARAPRVAWPIVLGLLITGIAISHLYLCAFAVGHL